MLVCHWGLHRITFLKRAAASIDVTATDGSDHESFVNVLKTYGIDAGSKVPDIVKAINENIICKPTPAHHRSIVEYALRQLNEYEDVMLHEMPYIIQNPGFRPSMTMETMFSDGIVAGIHVPLTDFSCWVDKFLPRRAKRRRTRDHDQYVLSMRQQTTALCMQELKHIAKNATFETASEHDWAAYAAHAHRALDRILTISKVDGLAYWTAEDWQRTVSRHLNAYLEKWYKKFKLRATVRATSIRDYCQATKERIRGAKKHTDNIAGDGGVASVAVQKMQHATDAVSHTRSNLIKETLVLSTICDCYNLATEAPKPVLVQELKDMYETYSARHDKIEHAAKLAWQEHASAMVMQAVYECAAHSMDLMMSKIRTMLTSKEINGTLSDTEATALFQRLCADIRADPTHAPSATMDHFNAVMAQTEAKAIEATQHQRKTIVDRTRVAIDAAVEAATGSKSPDKAHEHKLFSSATGDLRLFLDQALNEPVSLQQHNEVRDLCSRSLDTFEHRQIDTSNVIRAALRTVADSVRPKQLKCYWTNAREILAGIAAATAHLK